MNIAIIGGGWVGCHLAKVLKENNDIVLFEKREIFSETSSHNQNRLHYGYHYARSYSTRNLCKSTFHKFIQDYGFCVKDVDRNLYCIPNRSSLLDLETYLKIFNDYPIEYTDHTFSNTQGCILTNEKYIDFKKAKEFFEEELKDLIIYRDVNKSDLDELSNAFDIVIDATNNSMGLVDSDFFYELTLTLIYDRIGPTSYDSVTFVDGSLFSIYPYDSNRITLTDVKLTPLQQFSTYDDLEAAKKDFSKLSISDKIIEFEERVIRFVPDFKKYFRYESYFLSVKSKIKDESADRYPVVSINGNVISCFTGKIQGIYPIEEKILNLIKQ